jgi:soluble lytic murein transglycosylase
MSVPIMRTFWYMNGRWGRLALVPLALLGLTTMAQAQTDGQRDDLAAAAPAGRTGGPQTHAATASLPPLVRSNFHYSPISDTNAVLYRRILDRQAAGDIAGADHLLAQVTDDRLRGPVLYQRYIDPTSSHPGFAELRDWLDRYADQPGADRVYRLAQARAPKNFHGALRQPVQYDWVGKPMPILSDAPKPYTPQHPRTEAQDNAILTLKKTIRIDIRQGNPSEALKLLSQDDAGKLLEPVEYDQLRGEIAKGFMSAGDLKTAMDLSLASIQRSAENAPDAGWIGGLVAWRQKDYQTSARLFQTVANSTYASSWMQAAGAYWASRAYMRGGEMAQVQPMLEKAAAHPRTFYGLLATKSLGWDFDFDWSVPAYTIIDRSTLSPIPAFQRASALVAMGETHMAEEELLTIDPGTDDRLRHALIAYAIHASLPALAMRLAETYPRPDGHLYDAALYPLSPWRPETGYRVDEAVLTALIRQESNFDPAAESASGAVGLMQLMPVTASFVSGATYEQNIAGRFALKDPKVNLEIGQHYVETLLYADPVGADLMSMLVAYNAGPTNLAHWKQQYKDTLSDPLLFIETMPQAETRTYVERVMANYWIYRIRLGLPATTLDAVAEGHWAPYVKPSPLDSADASGAKPYTLADALAIAH